MRVAPRGVLVVMIAVLAAWLLVGCRGSTHLISTEQEIQIGQEAAAEFDREHSVSRSSPMALRLAEIGERVGQAASPPDYPYSFTLVNEDVDNAFALPGGPVYFYQGLINSLGNDEHQIAWVCAHEITHIRQQHAIRRIERAIGASLLIELALGEGTAADVAGLVGSLSLQHYSRDHEHMADQLGCRWAHQAGYDATAAIAVLQKFQEIQGKEPNDFEIMFMSHPGNEDRVNVVKTTLEQYGISGAYHP